MIDVHCHILPGIDDGATDLKESIALLKLAVADGITHMVATPHINPGYFDNNLQSIARAFSLLCDEVNLQQLPIQLAAAAEIRVTSELIPAVEQQTLPFVGEWDGFKVLLLEFPHSHIPAGSDKLVKWLLSKNIRPLIAHPERNRDIQANLQQLTSLRAAGCLFQLTASSLLGDLGERNQLCAMELLKNGVFTLMATDSHNLRRRPPRLKKAWQLASQQIGEVAASQLVIEHPLRLTQGLKFFQADAGVC